MLYELSVENFALIHKLSLPLSSGFNALTGETGAGKSLIVDAVALLTGGRATDTLIRSGSDRCRVEGVFGGPYPPELNRLLEDYWEEDSEDDNLILSRELVRDGRSTCRINGRAATLNLLKQAGKLLVNIHGQHEHMLLLEEDKQLQLLDSFGGSSQLVAREAVGQAYASLTAIQNKLTAYEENKADRSQRLDWLAFQINEIEQVAPQADEDEALQEEAQRLSHGEKLLTFSAQAHQALDQSGLSALADASAAMRQTAALDKQAEELHTRLESLYYEAEDVTREISHYRDNLSVDTYRLEEVESRLAQLGRLKKKYGPGLQDVLRYLEKAKEEQQQLSDLDISGDALAQQLAEATTLYNHKAEYLSLMRQKTGLMLGEAITGELQKLAMSQACFRVDLPSCEISAKGREKAQFMICSNAGEQFQPVAKIASGGELSRIVLGMKVILSKLDRVPTLIFDEVDTGLSGRALDAVAERLAVVGQNAQTLVVSHGAVMAAAADRQIHISKQVMEGRTVITAKTLQGEKRVEEIARMIAGTNITPTTIKQAEEMLAAWSSPPLEEDASL